MKLQERLIRVIKIERRTDDVKEALITFGPLGISINVIEPMLLYTGGVIDDRSCIGVNEALDHDVLLTGWVLKDGKEAWEIKNSWSTYWGDNGYFYVQTKNQSWNCGITTNAVGVKVIPCTLR